MPGGMYSVAGAGTLLPQMKTFYQKPSSATMSVAPYATTTLINTCGSSIGGSMQGKSLQPSVSFSSKFLCDYVRAYSSWIIAVHVFVVHACLKARWDIDSKSFKHC